MDDEREDQQDQQQGAPQAITGTGVVTLAKRAAARGE